MEQTKFREKCNDKINNILDYKEQLEQAKMNLDSEKESLLELLRDNRTYKFYGDTGIAKIIAFDRESLIKDDVLITIDKVNKGLQKDRINVNELMKKSSVCFVMVRGLE